MTNPIARIERHDYRDPLGHPLAGSVDWKAVKCGNQELADRLSQPMTRSQFGSADDMIEALLAEREEAAAALTSPQARPMALDCPACKQPHIDEGEWATRPHKTHQCQHCGHEWRPFDYPTVGVWPGRERLARPDGGEVVEKPCKECGGPVHVWANDSDPLCFGCYADTNPAPAPDVDYVDIANRTQEITGKGMNPSTVKAVLEAFTAAQQEKE